MQDFKKLIVWQEAKDMSIRIYRITQNDPFFEEEKYGLVQQIRRATTSICLNIAEGAGSISQMKFVYFLYNAMGSSKEVECCLILANELGYITKEEFHSLSNHSNKISSMLTNLIDKVKNRKKQPTTYDKLQTKNYKRVR